jgi:hypothetical protein
MKLNEYKVDDKVSARINNPELDNQAIWVDGEVTEIKTIYPSRGERFKPYPMVMVLLERTYCDATPIYEVNSGIKIFTHNKLRFYTKPNNEGFIYDNHLKLRA